jgi:hypothetical protein
MEIGNENNAATINPEINPINEALNVWADTLDKTSRRALIGRVVT